MLFTVPLGPIFTGRLIDPSNHRSYATLQYRNAAMIAQGKSRRLAGCAACSIVATCTLFLLVLTRTDISTDNEFALLGLPTSGGYMLRARGDAGGGGAASSNTDSGIPSINQYRQPVVQYSLPVGVSLLPGANQFYTPQVAPIGPSVIDGDPMGQWGDIFQRVTSELATDTAEIANLDRQVRCSIAL
jgi:hypothetical protein